MNIKKAIEKIVSPEISKYGFNFIGKKDSLSWRYSKEKDDFHQYITFTRSQFDLNCIRIEFSTSLNEMDIVYGSQLILDSKYLDRGFWRFSDERSLESTLQILKNLIIEKGIECLDILSIPILKPSADASKILLSVDNKKQRAERFATEQKLDFSIESLLILERNIETQKSNRDDVDWEYIFESSIYFGEVTINQFNGEWRWDERQQTTVIGSIAGKQITVAPLLHVTRFWGNPKRSSYSLFKIINDIDQVIKLTLNN
ncbi:hypothetical protein [Paenibacillus aestuarii]|uniref:DUF4304 domain-containing protein n=1 Tax=Paenibacillus aestuarii TaxID=516965 RepID=A0ABW0K0N4_9BACL|nr:hypothetical protein [Paenibacillus aestuarii]